MCSPPSKSECRIFFVCLLCIVLSLCAAIPMFILSYPGDECLLFVSVRGEALIYGNPAGCNFIFYGHLFVIIGGQFLRKTDSSFAKQTYLYVPQLSS